MFLFTVDKLASSDMPGNSWYRPSSLDPISISVAEKVIGHAPCSVFVIKD